MKAVLKLELIGDNLYEEQKLAVQARIHCNISWREQLDWIRYGNKRLRPWVAKISGLSNGVMLQREFVRYQSKDYTYANSKGSRGIFVYYVLGDGIYEVNKRETWQRARRYFIRVTGDTITEITRDEVLECLKSAG